MTRSNQFDHLNRLTNLVWNVGGSNVASFAYQYNDANQRTRATLADGSYWLYQYDALGQVTSAKRYWSDDTPVAGQQTTFTFDDIGNRKVTTSGGDQTGANLRSANYAANTLNQITSRDVPGYVNILGTATNTATVSLWSKDSTALYTSTTRKGDYFRGELPFNNSTGAVWLTITNLAALSNYTGADVITNTVGSKLLAKTPEAFTYDADGNLTSDSLWTNVWNGENRRITIESRTSVAPVTRVREQWTILADGRWIERVVSTNNGTAYYPSLTNRYVWDGQVLLAVLDNTNGVVVSFMRGLDLSGSLQGAGGVGGVLVVKAGPSAQCGAMTNTAHFTCYDGNGNVTALMNAATGAESARYECGPFAERLRETGPMAKLNPIRFSTQYADDVTDATKYLFRDLVDGRWPSRDPLEEKGGFNLYGFANNDSPNSIDYIGLTEISVSAGVGLGLHAGGSISLKISQENGLKVIELTAEGSAGVGIGLKGHVKAFGKSFGLNFDFEGPSLKRSQTVKLTIACDGYINFHESIDLIRFSADQQFSAGIGLGFVAINADVGVHVNGGIAWEINAVPHIISTWLEWNGELGGYYKITGGFGERTDAVLAEGHTPDSHEFHKLLFGPLIYRF